MMFFSFSVFPIRGWSSQADGKIRFFNYHLQETEIIQYEDKGVLLPEGLRKIEKLFRSRDSDQKHAVHPDLVRLIDQIEDHFRVRQVEIISGFRSAAFNQKLKEAGHKVARESLHIQGMAADLHLDEISEEALRDYARSLKKGGVGYYPNHNMVHVDVGPVRQWGEAYPRLPWVGEKNAEVPVTLTVTPDRSFSKKLDRFQAEPLNAAEPVALNSKVTVEFFEGGKWKEAGTFESGLPECSRPMHQLTEVSLEEFNKLKLEFGKYRFRVNACDKGLVQYSNEFYLKRK